MAWLKSNGRPFLFLTNFPSQTPADLSGRLAAAGLDVPSEALLQLGDGHRGLPDQPGGRQEARVRGGGRRARPRAVPGRLHALRDRRRLRGAGRDPRLQLRDDPEGGPARAQGGALHRHEPRRGRPPGPAELRSLRRAHRAHHGQGAVLRGQALRLHDAIRAAPPAGALRGGVDGGGQHGHRRHRRRPDRASRPCSCSPGSAGKRTCPATPTGPTTS